MSSVYFDSFFFILIYFVIICLMLTYSIWCLVETALKKRRSGVVLCEVLGRADSCVARPRCLPACLGDSINTFSHKTPCRCMCACLSACVCFLSGLDVLHPVLRAHLYQRLNYSSHNSLHYIRGISSLFSPVVVFVQKPSFATDAVFTVFHCVKK